MSDDDEAVKAANRARVDAFLAELSALCTKHGMYIDAWAEYADSAYFGVELADGRVITYSVGGGTYSGDYPVEVKN